MRPSAHLEGPSCPLRRAGARCAGVVRQPVVLLARGAGVVRTPVVLCARYGQGDRVLGVVQIKARDAGRDLKCVWFRSRPVVQEWYHAGVVGGCGRQASDSDRDAEHGIAVDRCAREIVGFLKAPPGALAATECQAVRRPGKVVGIPFLM